MMLRKKFSFEASHLLPKHPGKCSRLHGHSWVLHVETEGRVNKETGFVMDYADMSAAVKPLIDALDHRHLGAWCVYGDDREKHAEDEVNSKKREVNGKGLLAEIWGDDVDYFDGWRVPDLPLDFYPTSENLLFWIAEQLSKKQFRWSKVALEETCTSYAELKLDEFMVWYTNQHGIAAAQWALAEWK